MKFQSRASCVTKPQVRHNMHFVSFDLSLSAKHPRHLLMKCCTAHQPPCQFRFLCSHKTSRGLDLTENSSQPEVNKFLPRSSAHHGRSASPEVITFVWPDLESMCCLTMEQPRKVCTTESLFFSRLPFLWSKRQNYLVTEKNETNLY